MRTILHASALIAALVSPWALSALSSSPGSVEFDEVSLRFELNQTDLDAEVVLDLDAPEGLRELRLEAPDGKTLFKLLAQAQALDAVGLKQFVIESGEPDITSVLQAFPEGSYRLLGVTVSGVAVESEVELAHELVRAPSYVPPDGALVPSDGFFVTWIPMPGAVAYAVEIEQDDLGFNLTCTVPGSVRSLQVPAGLLLPDTEYELGVSSIAANGNVCVAESSFTTLP
jgi:hypothetical protein